MHIIEELGSCSGRISAVLTTHGEEPTLDPEAEPPRGTGLVVSSFDVQTSGREICGTGPLEAVRCTVDRADSCEIVATCRVWQDRRNEAEVPQIERRTENDAE